MLYMLIPITFLLKTMYFKIKKIYACGIFYILQISIMSNKKKKQQMNSHLCFCIHSVKMCCFICSK